MIYEAGGVVMDGKPCHASTCSPRLLRYAEVVATALDKDKLHDVLDQVVIVIDEQDLERSRKDPRVRAFHESSAQLMAELEAEGANYD